MLEDEFIDFGIPVSKAFGLDEASARLISLLYIEPGELSTDDISKNTGYSMASISNKMKLLMEIGMVKRIKKKGSKRVYYFMEKDIRLMLKRKIDIALENEIYPAKKKIPLIIKKYENTKNKKEKEQLRILKEYIKQIIKLEELYNKIKKLL